MEAIEMAVYILLAVLIGGMLFAFFLHLNKDNLSIRTQSQFQDKGLEFRLTREDFLASIKDYWEGCDLGMKDKHYNVYVEGNGTLQQSDVERYLLKYNVDEPKKEDLNMINIKLPSIVTVECSGGTLHIG